MVGEPGAQRRDVRLDVNIADHLALVVDGFLEVEGVPGEIVVHPDQRRWQHESAFARTPVFGEDHALGVEDPNSLDIGLLAQDGEVIPGVRAVLEEQGGGVVVGEDAGEGREALDHGTAEAEHVEEHETYAGQQQCHAGSQHYDQHLLALDRHALESAGMEGFLTHICPGR